MIQYDKQIFSYIDNPNLILEKFKHWSKNDPLLLIEDKYTNDYLSKLDNTKELVSHISI